MELKRVLVVYKDSVSEEHRRTRNDVKNILTEYGIAAVFIERSELNKENTDGYDLILTVGGDGTLLRTSRFVSGIAVLGVNFDPKKSEGVLCAAIRCDLKEKIARIIDKKFTIKTLTRAKVFFENTGQSYNALNEVYVGSAKPYNISKYILKFGKVEEEQKSSGVVISSGTGSTAWYGSITGENFDPEMEELRFVVREPYSGKLTKFNITDGRINAGQKLNIISKSGNNVVAIDSTVEAPLRDKEEITVSVSSEPLRLITF